MPTVDNVVSLTLTAGESAVIGRNSEATLQVHDSAMSRLHCRLEYVGGKLILTDLNSSNGTFVNGQRISGPTELVQGTLFTIGDHSFRINFSPDSVRLPAPTSVDTVQVHDDGGADDFDNNSAMIAKKVDVSRGPLLGHEINGLDFRTAERLNTVCTFANKVFAATDEKAILEEATRAALRISGARQCAAVLLHQSSNLLNPVCCYNSDGDCTAGGLNISSTVVRHVIHSGESVITANASADERFALGMSIALNSISSVICVPLAGQEGVIGAFYADNRAGDPPFEEQDMKIMAAVAHQAAVAVERSRLEQDLEHLFFGSVHALAASIEAKDRYTKGHSERVTCYALLLADALGVEKQERTTVELAGLLHDVGKIAVPESVLRSPNRLTDEEFRLIKLHPVQGAEIISKMPELSRLTSIRKVAEAAKHHHERYDGTGYPDGLVGKKIPLVSRILAIADTFDAITSTRTYRPGQSPEKAIEILLEGAGTQFDPQMPSLFAELSEKGALAHLERVESHIKFDRELLNQCTIKE